MKINKEKAKRVFNEYVEKYYSNIEKRKLKEV